MPRIIAQITTGPNGSWQVRLGGLLCQLRWDFDSARAIMDAYRFGLKGYRKYLGPDPGSRHGMREYEAQARIQDAINAHEEHQKELLQ